MHPAVRTARFIVSHPLAGKRPVRALGRYLRWQLVSRFIAPEGVAVPFVEDTVLFARNGMRGATGNIYAGVHDFEEMGFLLHLLKPGDVFVDVGANVGSYSVLASGVCRAESVSFEPIPQTFRFLETNVAINGLSGLCQPFRKGIGAHVGELEFLADSDTTNRVAPKSDGHNNSRIVRVPVTTLDAELEDTAPTLLKIDVEGFEKEVLTGAPNTLNAERLSAVIIELNGSGQQYGFTDAAVDEVLRAAGFTPVQYNPFQRRLTQLGAARPSNNGIYLREVAEVQKAVAAAPPRSVLGIKL